MKYLVAIALLVPLASRAAVANFTNCRMAFIGGFSPFNWQPFLDDEGDLFLSKKMNAGAREFSKSPDGSTEKMVLTSDGMYGQNKSTYTLTKKDGLPSSLDTKLENHWLELAPEAARKNLEAMNPDPVESVTTEYGYHEKNCYVNRISSKRKSGKVIVSYDFETCNGIMAAIKKNGGAKKFQECSQGLMEIQKAIKAGESKINSDKTQLDLAFVAGPSAPGSRADSMMNAFSAVTMCAMTMKNYGYKFGKDEDPNPWGAFFGGFPGMAPQAQPKKEDDDSKSVPAP